MSNDDERFFTMTATAQGGASVTVEYKMMIVDEPFITNVLIACFVLGGLLCLFIVTAVACFTCCSSAETVDFEESRKSARLSDQEANIEGPLALVPGGNQLESLNGSVYGSAGGLNGSQQELVNVGRNNDTFVDQDKPSGSLQEDAEIESPGARTGKKARNIYNGLGSE